MMLFCLTFVESLQFIQILKWNTETLLLMLNRWIKVNWSFANQSSIYYFGHLQQESHSVWSSKQQNALIYIRQIL